MIRPRRFFRTGVAPGDQAPGLVFAMTVTAIAAGTHLATWPEYAIGVGDSAVASLILVYALYVILIGPVVLHLVAAVHTVGLLVLVPDRGGVSETVQVLAYAAAPCVFAGIPIPEIRLLVTAWGAVLLCLGTMVVHETSPARAIATSVLPAILVFGYAFGGFEALEQLSGSVDIPNLQRVLPP